MGAAKTRSVMGGNAVGLLLSVASIGTLVVLWVVASSVNAELVPNPAMTFDRLTQLFTNAVSNRTLVGHIAASIRRVVIALSVSTVIGITLGVLIGWNKTMRATLGTLFELIRPIPPIAWLPLVIMWFGLGEFPKVVIVFIGTLMPIVINTYTGIRLVDPLNLDVGRVFNATERQLLFEIAIPSASPAIFAGLKNSVGGGWMVVLAAEMIGADAGVGFLITRGMEFFDVPLILVGIISIGGVGALLSVGVDLLERVVLPWNKKLGSD